MKKNVFPLAISLVMLLLIGCQDHSMTNPVSSQPLNKTSINQRNIVEGVIPLDYKLMDPFRRNIEYRLIGDIDFTEKPINLISSETFAEKEEKLTEALIANLKIISSADIKNDSWKISANSDDIIKFSSDNADILLKSYPIIGMENRTDLVCRFIVTPNGEKLDKVMLESPVLKNTAQSN